MRLGAVLAFVLAGVGVASCGADPCDPLPTGCVRGVEVGGSCSCTEWETVSVETVPLKYVVVGVEYRPPGSVTRLAYGYTSGGSLPAATSDLGSRFRVVIRPSDGTEIVAALGSIVSAFDREILHRVTAATVEVRSAGGDATSGSAYGLLSFHDVPLRAYDTISLWVNPAVTIVTDRAGGRRVDWGWSPGACYRPVQAGCQGPRFMSFALGQLDGTIPVAEPYHAAFLSTLTPEERAAILSYHPLHDPARDPATLATDPRFEQLGAATLAPDAASFPPGRWTPCVGDLADERFVSLAENEVPFGWSPQTAAVQHGVLAHLGTCLEQRPGIEMGTTTPGCELTTTVWADRAFGTLLFAPITANAACTTMP